MGATADGHRWLDKRRYANWVENGYCVAAILGHGPEAVLAALDAVRLPSATGLAALGDASYAGGVVAHYANVNAVDRFVQWRHGEVLVEFEPLTGYVAVAPDAATRARILDCGLRLDGTDDLDHTDEEGRTDLEPRVFALAERLSGIRLTPQTPEGEFIVAGVRLPAGA